MEGSPPFCEATLFGGEIIVLVGDVVNQPHEGIESGKAVAALFRQEKKRVVEITARRTRYTVARFVRLREEAIVGLLLRGGRRLRLFCHEMRAERAARQAPLLAFANGGAGGEGVVGTCFDGIEHGAAAAAENFEIGAEAWAGPV